VYREIPLVRQGKRNHNICGIAMDWSSEVLQEYGLEAVVPDPALLRDSPLFRAWDPDLICAIIRSCPLKQTFCISGIN